MARQLMIYGEILILLIGSITAKDIRCGQYVEFHLSQVQYCLTSSGAAVAFLRHVNDQKPARQLVLYPSQELKALNLYPKQQLDIGIQREGTLLSLSSVLPVCYILMDGQCRQTTEEGSQRNVRNVHGTMSPTDENNNPAHYKLLTWTVASLLVLFPLATASFLCCTSEDTETKDIKIRRMSTKKSKRINAASSISINITDSNNPLGSDSSSTFQKSSAEKNIIEGPKSCHSLKESSLDVGTRDSNVSVKHGISLSSVASLGPRIPPEGCSLENLYTIDKPLKIPIDMTLPPTIPPPASHQRQHSTPISVPAPLSPLHKPRPLTVIGQPSPQNSPSPRSVVLMSSNLDSMTSCRLSGHLVLTKSTTSPPLSPALNPIQLTAESSHDNLDCTQCRSMPDSQVPANISDNETEEGVQASNPQYHEVRESEIVSSVPGPSLPDPVYERIGSVRRKHIISTRTDDNNIKPRPPYPSPIHSPNCDKHMPTCPLPPPLEMSKFPQCALPSEGAPLPPRPPTLGLVVQESTSEHNYERLPSTFGVDSPEDILYAHITTPENEDPQLQGQRAQILKIDSKGYAEVLNSEIDRSSTPDALYSPTLAQPLATQAEASDYEVPVKIALPSSPSLLQSSLTHNHPMPIPVPSPMAPFSNLDRVPPSLEGRDYLNSTGPSLRRQAAIVQNPLPLPARSFHVIPQQERDLQESRRDSQESHRDSNGSAISYHLSYRLSNTSSGLEESVCESLGAIAEEGNDSEKLPTTEPVVIKQKIYEVENRSRTRSYPSHPIQPTEVPSNKHKAQTMHVRISFNQDSQTV